MHKTSLNTEILSQEAMGAQSLCYFKTGLDKVLEEH